MSRGNGKKVMTDAKKIARRLRETSCTQAQLMTNYHCGYKVIMKVICSQIPQDEWLQIRKKKLAQGGIKTRFQKGHISPTKGIKGVHYSPTTELKKGHLPARAKKLGTITVHNPKRDRPFRMIATPGLTPTRHKWIPYAQYLWEKEHGPVPKGFFVAHADDNGMNDTPGNLILVDRKGNMELMKKNRPGWRKKASKTLKKSWQIRRMKKARELRKIQKEAEIIRHRQIRLQQQNQLETEQRKMIEQHIQETYGLQVCIWECCGCAAEYHQEQMPERCVKCGGHSFERNIYRRKTG